MKANENIENKRSRINEEMAKENGENESANG
jgi:hypothetical protein